MRISKITTNSNQNVQLSKITVLVGPNNSGKSQFLRDIHNFFIASYNKNPRVIIKNFNLEKSENEDFHTFISRINITTSKNNPQHYTINGIGDDLLTNAQPKEITKETYEIMKNNSENFLNYSSLLDFFGSTKIAYLNAESRLNISSEKESFDAYENTPQNLLQAVFLDKNSLYEVQKIFEKTFNMKILYDIFTLRKFCFRVNRHFDPIPDNLQDAINFMKDKNYPKLDYQGDGFKSFVGLVLAILLVKDRIILIDEPEAFLHPTQAKALGNWIAAFSSKITGQIFISTHSSNFLRGLLSANEFLSVYRLNRIDDENNFTSISKENLNKLAFDPLLSNQTVLESIFFKGTVVCEAEKDRIFYNYICRKEFENEDINFIHSNGKHNIHTIVSLLKEINAPVHAVVDFDILNDEDNYHNLINAFKGNLENFDSKRMRIIQDILKDITEKDTTMNLINNLEELLTKIKEEEIKLNEVRITLNKISNATKYWFILKNKGINGLSSEVKTIAKELINDSNKLGLFIVEDGELENLIPLNVSKRRWFEEALQLTKSYTPENVKKFVSNIITGF